MRIIKRYHLGDVMVTAGLLTGRKGVFYIPRNSVGTATCLLDEVATRVRGGLVSRLTGPAT